MAYWLLAILLVAFGFITGFSIGAPFLLLGLALVLLGPFRARPRIFWPLLAAVAAFNVGYWAVAPLYCVATSDLSGAGQTVCTSFVGIRYTGEGLYNPSALPALGFGLLVAVLAGALALVVVVRRRRTGAPPAA